MKKSTLLSFATAAAIVVTSAGTYAAWDVLEATTEERTVELGNAINLTAEAGNFTLNPVDRTVLDKVNGQVATGGITVNLSTVDQSLQGKRKIILKPTVTFEKASNPVSATLDTDYTVEIKKAGKDIAGAGGVFTDTEEKGTNDFTYSAEGTVYTVNVTPKSNALEEATATITVNVELQ